MSTHIQFNSCVIQLPYSNRYGRNVLLALAEGGDNNVIETGTNRIARDWYPVALGDPFDVMTKIIRGATDCEWGLLRFATQRRTKPENYIRHWRALMESPLSVDEAANRGFSFSRQIEVTLCQSRVLRLSGLELENLDRSIQALDKEGLVANRRKASFMEVYPHEDSDVWAWRFDISTQPGWDVFHHYAPQINSHPLRDLKVHGPARHRAYH